MAFNGIVPVPICVPFSSRSTTDIEAAMPEIRGQLLPVYVLADESMSMNPYLGELNAGLASLHEALIAEGSKVKDPQAFTQRLNELLVKAAL